MQYLFPVITFFIISRNHSVKQNQAPLTSIEIIAPKENLAGNTIVVNTDICYPAVVVVIQKKESNLLFP